MVLGQPLLFLSYYVRSNRSTRVLRTCDLTELCNYMAVNIPSFGGFDWTYMRHLAARTVNHSTYSYKLMAA